MFPGKTKLKNILKNTPAVPTYRDGFFYKFYLQIFEYQFIFFLKESPDISILTYLISVLLLILLLGETHIFQMFLICNFTLKILNGRFYLFKYVLTPKNKQIYEKKTLIIV